MPTYRLCYHNPATGRLDFFTEFDAADDAAAFRSSEARPDDDGKMLWCGDRRVDLPPAVQSPIPVPDPELAPQVPPPVSRRPRRPGQ